jgi:hypothetical protein
MQTKVELRDKHVKQWHWEVVTADCENRAGKQPQLTFLGGYSATTVDFNSVCFLFALLPILKSARAMLA